MDFYTCHICNTRVNIRDREYHEMTCNNAFRENEFQDMIPCEICGRLVNYNNYSEHLNRCYSFTSNSENQADNIQERVDSVINNLQNLLNNDVHINENIIPIGNNHVNEPENDMNVDNSDDEMPELLDDNINININIDNLNEFSPDSPDVNNLLNSLLTNIINTGLPINADIDFENMNDSYTELTNLSQQIGNVELGIEEPDKYFKKSVNIGFKCPICYSECENTMITECNHEICVDCTKEWYSKNKKCVICMNEIKTLK